MANFPTTATSIPELPVISADQVIDTNELIIQQNDGTKGILFSQLKKALFEEFIGTIQTFTHANIGENYLICDGSAKLIVDYPKLYNKIGNSFDPDNLADVGSFLLPNLLDKFVRNTNGTSIIGEERVDTMRKITGSFNGSLHDGGSGNGALSIVDNGNSGIHYPSSGGLADKMTVYFNSLTGVEGQEGTQSPNVGGETAPVHTVLLFAIRAK